MDTKKIAEFIELLSKLPREKQIEVYYMVKGAVYLNNKEAAKAG